MIARSSLAVIGNSLIGAVLGYVALLAMARYMGDALVGARAYVLAVVFLLGMVTRLGFPTTHARRLARQDDIARSNGTYLAIKVGLTAVFVVMALAAMWLWFDLLQKPATDITRRALGLGIAVVAVKSLRDFTTNTFRGLERILQREASLLINTLVTAGLTVLAAVAYAQSHDRWSPLPGASTAIAEAFGATSPASFETALTWLIAAYLTGEVVAFVAGWIMFLAGRIPVGRPDAAIARAYRDATVPIMFVTMAGLMMRHVDQVMIGFWHDAAQLGHYAAATKLSELLLILAMGVRVVLLPLVARLQQADRMDDLGRVLVEAERWISLLIWPVIAVVFVAPRQILHILLSDAFLPAAPILLLLMVHSLVNSLTIPLRTNALGLGQQGFAARVAIVAVVANIGLNVLLVPRYGGVGASIATVLAGLMMLGAYRRKAHQWTGHPMIPGYLVRHAAAAVGTGIVLWAFLDRGPEVARFYDLAWLGLLGLTIYTVLLVLVGGLHRGDLDNFRRLLQGRTPKNPTEVDRS